MRFRLGNGFVRRWTSQLLNLFPVFIGSLLITIAQPSRAATLVYTNDLLGEIEPCGCRKDPKGGFVRKEAYLKEYSQKNKGSELILVDTGNLLFDSESIAPGLQENARVKAQHIIEAMNLSRHRLAVAGVTDFAMGYDEFLKITSKARFKYLASNLKSAVGNWETSVILEAKIEKKTIKLGFVGVLGPKLKWPKEIQPVNAKESLTKILDQFKSKNVDLIIALTHQGLEADRALAKNFPQINIIVGANSHSYLQEPEKLGSSFIYQTSLRGQQVGILPLSSPFTGQGHQMVELDDRYDTDQKTDITQLVAGFKSQVAKLSKKEDELAVLKKLDQKRGEAHFQTFPKCAECHVQQFDFWRKTQHARALSSLRSKNQLRNKECLKCHSLGLDHQFGYQQINFIASIFKGTDLDGKESHDHLSPESMEEYLKTLHEAPQVTASVPLPQGEASRDPASFPEPTLIMDSLKKFHQAWAPVQCENCHQAGKNHPLEGSYLKTVEQSNCLNCHTPERAPSWFDDQKKLIQSRFRVKRMMIQCPSDTAKSE